MVGLPYLRGFVDVGLPGPLLDNTNELEDITEFDDKMDFGETRNQADT